MKEFVPNSKNLAIFLPGLFAPKESMNPLARRFQAEGYETKVIGYPALGTLHPVDTAQIVAQGLQEVSNTHDHVTVIGHSLGGIIARELSQHYRSSLRIDSTVSIASPHEGYRTVLNPAMRFTPCGRALAKDSPYLTKLNKTPTRNHLRVQAQYDWVNENVNAESGFSKTGNETIEVPAGHLSVVLLEQTFWEIWSWLTYSLNVMV